MRSGDSQTQQIGSDWGLRVASRSSIVSVDMSREPCNCNAYIYIHKYIYIKYFGMYIYIYYFGIHSNGEMQASCGCR